MWTFIIRILFAVILPLLPDSVSSNGIVYDQRPTLPRVLIAITVSTVPLYNFAKLLMPIDTHFKCIVELKMVQLILLSIYDRSCTKRNFTEDEEANVVLDESFKSSVRIFEEQK